MSEQSTRDFAGGVLLRVNLLWDTVFKAVVARVCLLCKEA